MSQDIDSLRKRKTSQCLSDLQLDCLVVEEKTENSASWIQHTTTCSLCAEKLRTRKELWSAFPDKVDLTALSAQALKAAELTTNRAQRHIWRRWFVILVPAATVVLALLFVFIPPMSNQPTQVTTRLKGKPSFSVIVKRGKMVFHGQCNGDYRAGDRLRFQVSTEKEQFFALYNMEASRKVTLFVPTEGTKPTRVPSGNKILLSGGVELDRSVGREYLVGVFCPRTYELGKVQQALEIWDLQKSSLDKLIESVLFPDCSSYLFAIKKVEVNP